MIFLNNYNVGRKMLIGSITILLSWMYKVGVGSRKVQCRFFLTQFIE